MANLHAIARVTGVRDPTVYVSPYLGEFAQGYSTPFAQYNLARQLLNKVRGLDRSQLSHLGLGGSDLSRLLGPDGLLTTALSGSLAPGAMDYLNRVIPRAQEEFRLTHPGLAPSGTPTGDEPTFLNWLVDRYNLGSALGWEMPSSESDRGRQQEREQTNMAARIGPQLAGLLGPLGQLWYEQEPLPPDAEAALRRIAEADGAQTSTHG
jgi:hypothetical protein